MNWLFLRGLARETQHWGSFNQEFARALKGEVLGLDLPGAGTEYQRKSPVAVAEMVHDVRQRWLLNKKNNNQPWSLLAVSLGAMVALKWQQIYPNDFSKLFLLNTSAKNLSKPQQRFNFKLLPQFLATGLQPSLAFEKIILTATTELSAAELILRAQENLKISQQHRMTITNILRQILAAALFSAPPINEASNKLIFLVANSDQLVQPSCSQVLANYYKAPIFFCKQGGHDLAVDQPQWIIDQVKNSVT